MLWIIALFLFALWVIGVATSYMLGGLIHILLVVALVLALVRVMSGNGPI